MLYLTYEAQSDLLEPVRAIARAANAAFGPAGSSSIAAPSRLSAAWEMLSRFRLTHVRPAYGIDHVTVGNREVAVYEDVFDETPFCATLSCRFAGGRLLLDLGVNVSFGPTTFPQLEGRAA